MDEAQHGEDEQTKLWNGSSGRAWVEAQETLDQMLQPFEDLLVEPVIAGSARQVLDIGCGTGSTTLALARRLGASGRCVGIDISQPMIAVARARAERESARASFVCASAQSWAFEPASFDMFISRFGVMFFEDPVEAFANLRRAARADAQLRFVAWRDAMDNPFMTTAERAAAPLLPNIPARSPNAPGQFAFADSRRVYGILEQSGWAAIELRPLDVVCTFPEKELVPYLTKFGPVGRVLADADDRTRAKVIDSVRVAFEPYVHGAEVRFTAACWLVGARALSASAEASQRREGSDEL